MSPSRFPVGGGDEGIRTLDPLLAGQVLSQLSYTPISSGLLAERASKIEQQLMTRFCRDFLFLENYADSLSAICTVSLERM